MRSLPIVGPLSITTPAERPLLDNFGGQFMSGKTLSPLSSSTLPMHKTSADEYFESLARGRAPAAGTATLLPASTVDAFDAALGTAKSLTVPEKTDSKLSNMLGNHRDLVDLDNICKIEKPPPPDTKNIFGNSYLKANDMTAIPSMGKPSFNWGTGMSLPTVQQQPILSLANQPAPAGSQQLTRYEPPWQTFNGQEQMTNIFTSAPTTNQFSVASTNPFL